MVYHARKDLVNLDSARLSQIEALRSERRSSSPRGKGEEEDRFGKVTASPNLSSLPARGIICFRKFICFVAFMVMPVESTFAVVVDAHNLTVIEEKIRHLDENALVVFDVDFTLIVAVDAILAPGGWDCFKKLRNKKITPLEKAEIFDSISHLQAKVTLINQQILHVIALLKAKGIRTIALTAIPAGKFGVIPNAEQWRVEQLQTFGIDFSWSFPTTESIDFSKFSGKGSSPAFKKGVLASGKYPKGEVLDHFLKNLEWTPSQIVFVDDRIEEVKSVEETFSERQIPVLSFHYTEATDYPRQFDKETACFQLNYLIENEVWLNDETARSIIRKRRENDILKK